MSSELKPKIRFKGFTDDWEQRKVLDLLSQPITDGPHETPELVEDGIPFISVDAIIDNKIDFTRKRGDISEKYDFQCCKKYKPELNDVYMVKSGSTTGKVAIVETTKRFNIWSPLAAMRTGNKTNPFYLYYLLQTTTVQKQVSDKASNGTQPNLSMRELESFPVTITVNQQEQNLIGKVFKELDNLITFHQRKCDKLVELKKSLLEKMFPQNNSVMPEIRFRGFTDDWEQHKFSDIYNFSQGMQVDVEKQLYTKDNDMEQFIRIIDVTTDNEPPRYIYNTSNKGHVEANDIFFVRYGAVGTIGYGYTGTIANNLFKLSSNKKYCNDFMFQQFSNGEFNKKLIEMSASTSMPAINFSALNSLTFYETNLNEQIKIGALFRSIDNLITFYQRKHDKLNKIKQSLLNDMFV